jgi:YidC/Oxa1 family membrane protein insertase
MFTTFIVQPIFNVLTLIYALLPGHNFGVAIILFTILTRFALYPLLKKQLRHTKAMRELQPELKKIKAQTKGNRQQESLLTMELYKEREIKPMSFIGLMALQIIVFFALFSGLNKIVNDPQAIYTFSYPFVQNLPSMQELSADISQFDNTLFGFVDLGRAAVSSETGFYFPAFLLVLGSSIIQFFQIRQTMPSDKQSRKLREILKDANSGKQADTSEINAAMGRNMSYLLPIVIFIVTIGFPAALSLYWFVGGLIAYAQQTYLLKQDEFDMTKLADATVISKKPLKKEKVDKKIDRKNAPVKVTTISAESESNPQKPKNTPKKAKSSKNRKKKRK